MHPVLGTMMPEICEAPHLPVFARHLPLCSGFNGGRRSSHSPLPYGGYRATIMLSRHYSRALG